MRRGRLFVATSLDGYIAGPGDDTRWRFDDADYGYAAFRVGVDAVLVGRRTYEIALRRAPWAYAGQRVIVFTRGGEAAVASPDTVATSRSPADVVGELRGRDGADLWLAGGGALIASFAAAGLIDEITVSIHPLLLGGGVPFVAPGAGIQPLALAAERRYPSGLMQLTYRAER